MEECRFVKWANNDILRLHCISENLYNKNFQKYFLFKREKTFYRAKTFLPLFIVFYVCISTIQEDLKKIQRKALMKFQVFPEMRYINDRRYERSF